MSDPIPAKEPQCVQYNNSTLNKALKPQGKDGSNNNTSLCFTQEDIINIQLPYDSNQPMNPNLWDSNFHLASLHGSLEHLLLDIKNIKESLI